MNEVKKSPEKATRKATSMSVAKDATTADAQKMSNTKVNEILNPTADARIKKAANFQILAGKHQFLTKKKEELDQFRVSSDGTKEKVVLKNAAGFSLEISNSQVVEEVIEVMIKTLNNFIAKSEKEVLEYNI